MLNQTLRSFRNIAKTMVLELSKQARMFERSEFRAVCDNSKPCFVQYRKSGEPFGAVPIYTIMAYVIVIYVLIIILMGI